MSTGLKIMDRAAPHEKITANTPSRFTEGYLDLDMRASIWCPARIIVYGQPAVGANADTPSPPVPVGRRPSPSWITFIMILLRCLEGRVPDNLFLIQIHASIPGAGVLFTIAGRDRYSAPFFIFRHESPWNGSGCLCSFYHPSMTWFPEDSQPLPAANSTSEMEEFTDVNDCATTKGPR